MVYIVVVRDNENEEFSRIPYPLHKALKKPIKNQYIDTKKEIRYFKTKTEARRALLANYKQNRGVLTPLYLSNTKIIKI